MVAKIPKQIQKCIERLKWKKIKVLKSVKAVIKTKSGIHGN